MMYSKIIRKKESEVSQHREMISVWGKDKLIPLIWFYMLYKCARLSHYTSQHVQLLGAIKIFIFFMVVFHYHIIVVLGVHYDIYKSAYNTS
jgi:hypothetical protein